MEPHMIEIELFSYLLVIGINHVGFISETGDNPEVLSFLQIFFICFIVLIN